VYRYFTFFLPRALIIVAAVDSSKTTVLVIPGVMVVLIVVNTANGSVTVCPRMVVSTYAESIITVTVPELLVTWAAGRLPTLDKRKNDIPNGYSGQIDCVDIGCHAAHINGKVYEVVFNFYLGLPNQDA